MNETELVPERHGVIRSPTKDEAQHQYGCEQKKYELICQKIFSSAGHTSLYFPSVKITFLKNILVRCLARVVSVVMHKDLTGQQSTCSSIKVVFRIFRLTILVICRSGMKGNLRNLGQMFQAIFLCTSLCFIVLCVKLLQCCLSVVRIPYFSSWLLWGWAAQQTFPKN